MNDLTTMAFNLPQEASGAIQLLVAQTMVARATPRDHKQCKARILDLCQDEEFAESAQFAVPRAGGVISGLNIRAIQSIAAIWGNLSYGWEETRRDDESSIRIWTVDTQSNASVNRTFTVRHYRSRGDHMVRIEREDAIREHVAAFAQRGMRAVIESFIPPDIRTAAYRETSAKCLEVIGGNLKEAINKTTTVFDGFGVTSDQLAKRLGHSLRSATAGEILGLWRIAASIRDNHSDVSDWFSNAVETRPAKRLPPKRPAPAPTPKPQTPTPPTRKTIEETYDEIFSRRGRPPTAQTILDLSASLDVLVPDIEAIVGSQVDDWDMAMCKMITVALRKLRDKEAQWKPFLKQLLAVHAARVASLPPTGPAPQPEPEPKPDPEPEPEPEAPPPDEIPPAQEEIPPSHPDVPSAETILQELRHYNISGAAMTEIVGVGPERWSDGARALISIKLSEFETARAAGQSTKGLREMLFEAFATRPPSPKAPVIGGKQILARMAQRGLNPQLIEQQIGSPEDWDDEMLETLKEAIAWSNGPMEILEAGMDTINRRRLQNVSTPEALDNLISSVDRDGWSDAYSRRFDTMAQKRYEKLSQTGG